MLYLLKQTIRQNNKEQGAQDIVDRYLYIFVQRIFLLVKLSLPLQKQSKIILGIDPGTLIMGFGLIEVNAGRIQLLEMGVLKLSSKDDAYVRLEKIHQKVANIIAQYHPTGFAIEAPFYGKNVQSMLKLGRAQGVAIAAAIQSGLTICEYAPKKIKQSITGNGNASKDQVMKMLQQILQFTETPQYLDATDALAVAVCHHFQEKTAIPNRAAKSNSWKDFLSNNPGRLKK